MGAGQSAAAMAETKRARARDLEDEARKLEGEARDLNGQARNWDQRRLIDRPWFRPILAAAIMLSLLPLLPAASTWAGSAISDVLFSNLAPTTVPNSSPPVTSLDDRQVILADPPAVPIETSCPNPGMGWVATFGWPGDLPAGASAYSIRWQLDGGLIIRHDIGGWTDPTKPPVAMLMPNGTQTLFFTDFVGDDGQILTSTEQMLEVAGPC